MFLCPYLLIVNNGTNENIMVSGIYFQDGIDFVNHSATSIAIEYVTNKCAEYKRTLIKKMIIRAE